MTDAETVETAALQATIARQREALETIAGYPLPTFEVDGRGPMVPFENADYLRTMATDALQPEE
jgi:hypothetical protein